MKILLDPRTLSHDTYIEVVDGQKFSSFHGVDVFIAKSKYRNEKYTLFLESGVSILGANTKEECRKFLKNLTDNYSLDDLIKREKTALQVFESLVLERRKSDDNQRTQPGGAIR